MVRFTGRWYRGRSRAVASEEVVRRFETMHGIPPKFLIDYDDGITHAYRRICRVKNRIVHIIDVESIDELQEMARNIPAQVGGAGYSLHLTGRGYQTFLIALGATSASYEAE